MDFFDRVVLILTINNSFNDKGDNCYISPVIKNSNCAADQPLCFRYIDSTIPLL